MPLLSPPRTLIELPVADKVIGDTIIKQKATFNSLTHSQYASGECVAMITVTVRSYALSGGTYGDSLQTQGVPDRTYPLVADNNCAVDAHTGAILAVRGVDTLEAWKARLNAFDQDVMLQGDFFELLREQPVKIGDMIRQYIQQADQAGKFLT